MARPLWFAKIVAISLIMSVLQSSVFAQAANQSTISYLGSPISGVPDLPREIDGSIPVRFPERSNALVPSWLLEGIRTIYYALANLAGLITTVIEGKWAQIWDALQILAVFTTIYIFPAKFYIFLQSVVSSAFRKSLLEGIWYAYHNTRMHGKLMVREEKWKIKRNFQNELVIETSDPRIPRGFLFTTFEGGILRNASVIILTTSISL